MPREIAYKFAYRVQPRLADAYLKLLADTNQYRIDLRAWQDEHPGYTVAIDRGIFGDLGYSRIFGFVTVPPEAKANCRNVRNAWVPYKGKRGDALRELLATVPPVPPVLRLAEKEWSLTESITPGPNGGEYHDHPDFEAIDGLVYARSAVEQNSPHLDPIQMSDYWLAKEKAAAT